MILQSLRMTARDWRAGELRFLLVALMVAVGALSSVGFFADRMRTGLNRDAHQLLGADLVISADQPINPAWLAEAQQRGLQIAQTVAFPSMALAGSGEQTNSKLSAVKAVTPGYPLRGRLKISVADAAQATVTDAVPAAGTVWADANLLSALQLKLGDSIKLGERVFKLDKLIVAEPDRGAAFMNFAPRVMLSMDDLASTGLIQYGSRVTYRLMLAGAAASIAAFETKLRTAIERDHLRGIRIESLENGRPEMRVTLDRAGQFLGLVSLLSAMLAAVAIAIAARRFMLRHLDACAMLRCLGLTQSQVTQLYLIEFLLLGLLGSLAGALLGYGAHFVLLEWLGKLVATDLPPATVLPGLQAIATGLVLLTGFALPPILQLRNVPHNRVIRREQDAPQAATLATYTLGLISFVALLLWQAGDLKLAAFTAGGFIGGLALFAGLAWACLRGLRQLRASTRSTGWRFALTALQRRPQATIVQIVALALGLMALLLLTVIRGDLVSAWRQSTPPDAPNRFVINIQPEQKDAIEQRLRSAGFQPANLLPMMRGRLIQINDQPIGETSYDDQRAKQLVEREFNLSTMTTPPELNQLIAGKWFDDSKPEASVEQGLAKMLNLQVGDKLKFDVAGQIIEAPVTSLRKLDWSSMRVNFYVILNPRLMNDLPRSWITALRATPAQENALNGLTRDFPNLSVVDIGSVVRQIKAVVDQVVLAVEFLFLFTLASGLLVLYAALIGSQEERIREAGLLRALGATRSQLKQAQRVEFLLVGALAGLLASTGAVAVGWSLAHFVFNFDWNFELLVWIAGIGAGALCAAIGGWAGLRDVLNKTPMETLRGA